MESGSDQSFDIIISDCCNSEIENPAFLCDDCIRVMIIQSTCFNSMRRAGEINEADYRSLLRINQECINNRLKNFGIEGEIVIR